MTPDLETELREYLRREHERDRLGSLGERVAALESWRTTEESRGEEFRTQSGSWNLAAIEMAARSGKIRSTRPPGSLPAWVFDALRKPAVHWAITIAIAIAAWLQGHSLLHVSDSPRSEQHDH